MWLLLYLFVSALVFFTLINVEFRRRALRAVPREQLEALEQSQSTRADSDHKRLERLERQTDATAFRAFALLATSVIAVSAIRRSRAARLEPPQHSATSFVLQDGTRVDGAAGLVEAMQRGKTPRGLGL